MAFTSDSSMTILGGSGGSSSNTSSTKQATKIKYKISWASGVTEVALYSDPGGQNLVGTVKKNPSIGTDPHASNKVYTALNIHGEYVEIEKGRWCHKRFLTKVESSNLSTIRETTSINNTNNTATANDDYKLEDESYAAYLDSDEAWLRRKENQDYKNSLVLNWPENNTEIYGRDLAPYLNMFGAPFIFTEDTDPSYFSGDQNPRGVKVGRTMMETIYSTPSCFSIYPGKVRYLPGFNSSQKDTFFREVWEKISKEDNYTKIENGGKLDGQLYDLQCDYNDYMNRYNVLARTSAIMLGLGDCKMPGTNMYLKNYDYSYYTTADRKMQYGKGIGGGVSHFLWQLEMGVESSIIQKNQYIHFFVTNEGISISEQHTTSITASPLESLINSSQLTDASRNLSYLFGGIMSGDGFIGRMGDDIDKLIDQANASGSYTGSFAKMASNYLKGGRIVAPGMIDSVQYDSSVTARMKFQSLTGDKLDIFLRTILPALAILNFVMPKQLSENMYTYPYIVRCYQPGAYNCDLAAITDMQLTRGGADDTSWTKDGLSTELEVSFTITPLYSSLMGGNGKNVFQFLTNTALLDYLGNLCGLDLKINNLTLKYELFKALFSNKFRDIPNSMASKVSNGIQKVIGDWFTF